MESSSFSEYKRIRLVIGGGLGVIASLVLLKADYPVTSFIALLLGLISSVRAIVNRAPIAGVLLAKVNGLLILTFPMLVIVANQLRQAPGAQGLTSIYPTSATSSQPEEPADVPQDPVVSSKPPEPLPTIITPSPEVNLPPKVKPEKETVLEFVRSAITNELGNDLDLVMQQYAPEVSYFGTTKDKQQVRADKLRHWKKWPKRREVITSDLTISKPRRNEFEVRFQSQFRNENETNGGWISGDLSNTFVLQRRAEQLFITGQSVSVSNIDQQAPQNVAGGMHSLLTPTGIVVEYPASLADKIVLEKASRHPKAKTLALWAANVVELTLLAEEKRDVLETMKQYAFQVKYFEEDVTSEHIHMDKAEYFQKWPGIASSLISKYKVHVTSKPDVTITFTTKFKMTDGKGSVERTGEIDHTFKLGLFGKELRITQQNGKVRNLKKRNLK